MRYYELAGCNSPDLLDRLPDQSAPADLRAPFCSGSPGSLGYRPHHQRDLPVPAVPGTGFIVSQTELRRGGFERVLKGPAPPLDRHQDRDPRPGRAPGGEVGELPI